MLIKGTEMRPYVPLPATRAILFPYREGELIAEDVVRKEWPLTYAYLKQNERCLRAREGGIIDHAQWYAYGRNQALDVMSLPKLITPDLAPRSSFLYDPTGELSFLGGAAGGYGIVALQDMNPRYLLGLLNSRLLNYCITKSGQQMESGYYSFESRFIRSAPIRVCDVGSDADKARHDKMVELVAQMLELKKQQARAPKKQSPSDRQLLDQKIAITDEQIDALVYELYGLTEEEVRIVEGSAK